MIAAAAAIYFAGGVLVPVECGGDHLIDPAAVESAVTPRTRAILPTQLNGMTCDMDALQAIADKHGLLIVENAALALPRPHPQSETGPRRHVEDHSGIRGQPSAPGSQLTVPGRRHVRAHQTRARAFAAANA